MLLRWGLFLCLALLVPYAWSEEAGDVDEVLTNAKLRAESGSKSLWSVATVFNYNGGSLNQPFGDSRANIGAITGTTPYADLDGNISVKYNLNVRDSFLLGGGLRWITPLSTGTPAGYDVKKFDVYDPSFNYQRIYKIGKVQSYFQLGPTLFTRSDVVAQGFIAQLSLYNVNAYDLGTSGVTLGLESNVAIGWFHEPHAVGTMSADDVRDQQSDYNFLLYPYLEYKFNDVWSFRTVSALISYEHTRLYPLSTWHKDAVTQSLGVGISVTRDIFLYPNLQFLPDQIRAAETNVGLTANINIF